MERLDPQASLQQLRLANSRLQGFFARFSGAAVLGTDEEVEALLHIEQTLQTVGQLLQACLQDSEELEVRQELDRYRENLIRLRGELGRMQDSATACRVRLFTRQKHLQAAKSWCAASRALG